MNIMEEEKMRALKELAKRMYKLMVLGEEPEDMDKVKDDLANVSEEMPEDMGYDLKAEKPLLEDELDMADVSEFMQGKRRPSGEGAATVAIEAMAAKPVAKKKRRGRKKKAIT